MLLWSISNTREGRKKVLFLADEPISEWIWNDWRCSELSDINWPPAPETLPPAHISNVSASLKMLLAFCQDKWRMFGLHLTNKICGHHRHVQQSSSRSAVEVCLGLVLISVPQLLLFARTCNIFLMKVGCVWKWKKIRLSSYLGIRDILSVLPK